MEKLDKINKDINVKRAPKLSFGEGPMQSVLKNSAGLSYGLKKLILSGAYAHYQVTANSSSSKSRTTGWKDCLLNA